MIVLFTDFGINGPYIGQLQAAIYQVNPDAKVINLFANAPRFNPVAAGYLLSAHVRIFPPGTTFLAVVDPGVGSEARRPIVATIDGKSYVGPDNGLFDALAIQAQQSDKREIVWRPDVLSASFHGRDLFAPIAAHLDRGILNEDWLGVAEDFDVNGLSEDLDQVIYIDDYGNAMTGIRASQISPALSILVNGVTLKHARTFSDVSKGEAFWYQNSSGLAEIAVNCGSAAEQLSLRIGTVLRLGSGLLI